MTEGELDLGLGAVHGAAAARNHPEVRAAERAWEPSAMKLILAIFAYFDALHIPEVSGFLAPMKPVPRGIVP